MSQRAPIVHLGLASIAVAMLVVGGRYQLGSWGAIGLRATAVWLATATIVHGLARTLPRGNRVVRGLAWGLAIASTLHQTALLRPQVVLPLALAGTIDVLLVAEGTAEERLDPDTAGKAVAGVATLAALVGVAILLPLSADASVGMRLSATILVAWASVTALALAPHLRTPARYLAAAGATSVAFLLLAAPVLPFGPLLGYWVTVLTVAVAVLAATYGGTREEIDPERARHEQHVHPIPDPVLAGLADRVDRFVETGNGGPELSRRIEAALDRDDDGRLLGQAVQTRADGATPDRRARTNALRDLLDVQLEDGETT